jgi:hypothetical protein
MFTADLSDIEVEVDSEETDDCLQTRDNRKQNQSKNQTQ